MYVEAGRRPTTRLRRKTQMLRHRTHGPTTWPTRGDALAIVRARPHLTQSVTTTLIVGTVLFAINQLDVVLSGHATSVTWLKVAVTYTVPFYVTNATNPGWR